MNAEFQRIARRDKKVILSDQCKEIEENNRMGKTRDLIKKIRDTKRTFQRWANILQNARLDEHKLESRLSGEKSITSSTQMTLSLMQKAKRN